MSPLLSQVQQQEQQPITVIVHPGMNMSQLIENLQQRNLLTSPRYFHMLAVIKNAVLHMRSGEYLISPQTTPNKLLESIIKGKVYMRKITFIEGWTFVQMKHALQKNPYLKHSLANDDDKKIMQMVAHKTINPEGLFFPDTYEYTWGNKDSLILISAYQEMQRFLQQQWQKRAPDLPYQDSYQALIVASMIERETPLDKEKPIIASVILQRWNKGMRLQVDPTVVYGLGKAYGTPLARKDFKDVNNPYNTYRHSGLPPTPISMPGAASIIAALHPQKTDYLYYVATGNGGHQFSATFEEHMQAVAAYRKYKQQQQNSDKP